MALVCSAVFTRLMSENKTNDILQRKWLTYKIFVSHSTKFLHCCVNDIILIQINKETKEINCHPKCLHHLVQCFCIVMSIILFWCKLVHTLHSPFFFHTKILHFDSNIYNAHRFLLQCVTNTVSCYWERFGQKLDFC